MKKNILTFVLLLIASFLVIFGLSKLEFRFENGFQDRYIRTFVKPSQMDDIKLIVIDDESSERVRYPWPRDMYIDLFAYLSKYAKAKIIVFDAVVASYDEYHKKEDKIFFNGVKNFDNLIAGYSILERSTKNAQKDDINRDKLFAKKTNINIRDERTIIPQTFENFSNLPTEYLKNVPYLGNIKIFVDQDGVTRTQVPIGSYKNKLYPTLPLQAYAMATGVNDFVLTDDTLCSNDDCKTFKMPITPKREGIENAFALVNWYKIKYDDNYAQYSHKYYSAIDVYDSYLQLKKGEKPKINPSEFKDAYVFIGGCASNEGIKDRKVTSLSALQAGVDYQATVFENMMMGQFMQKMPIMQNLIIIFVLALISAISIRKTSIRNTLLVTAILLLMYYILSLVMINNRILVMIITPVIVELLVFCVGYSYKFFIEDRTKKKLQKAMGKYLSKDIMKKVVKDMDDIEVGGKRADVSVLFVDIRGFTSISEKLPPEEVIEILNEYIATIEPIVRKYDGVVNKFIGDAIMAIFGEPIVRQEHAKNAVLCADEILQAMSEFQAKLLNQGKPKIEVGLSINSGEVFIGNIGSSERLEYTVIGDVVNTASRIEAFNKIYKTKFLISEETYKRVRNFVEIIEIKDVDIRGKANTINIYEVLRITKCP